MTLAYLDSRMFFGTDIECSNFWDTPNMRDTYILYPKKQTVRVFLGELGKLIRMSAPDLDIVVEGSNKGEAWSKFLEQIKQRNDGAWLSFDVGPTRREEIKEGLNALEDEDWSESVNNDEG